MKLLVIGSNSFSSSHFINEALKNNHIVFGVSRSEEPKPYFYHKWSKEKSDSNKLKEILNFNQ